MQHPYQCQAVCTLRRPARKSRTSIDQTLLRASTSRSPAAIQEELFNGPMQEIEKPWRGVPGGRSDGSHDFSQARLAEVPCFSRVSLAASTDCRRLLKVSSLAKSGIPF